MRVPGIRFVQGRNDYTDGDGRKYGIAIHNTSNDASDEGEASYATRRPDGVSSHFYADDNSVTQSLDTGDRAGHAGSRTGNENAIAVEITGGNGKSRQWWLDNVAWDQLGAVLAWLIRNDPDLRGFEVRRATVAEMKANPKVKAFYGHNDMRLAWGGTTHTDPGPNFPWDRLFQAVNAALEDDMTRDEMLALLRSEDGKHAIGQAVWGYDPGYRDPDDKSKGVWPAVPATYFGDDGGNGTVAPSTALARIVSRLEELRTLAHGEAAEVPPAADVVAEAVISRLPAGQPVERDVLAAALVDALRQLAGGQAPA